MGILLETTNTNDLLAQLEKLADADQATLEKAFADDLQAPQAVNAVRYAVMRSTGLDPLPEVLATIDKIANRLPVTLIENPTQAYLSNLAFFNPTRFWELLPFHRTHLRTLEYGAAASLLSNKSNFEKLIEALKTYPDLKLSPALTMMAAFRTVNTDAEVDTLRLLYGRIDQQVGTQAARTSIARRLQNINRKLTPVTGSLRAALMINGQFRGLDTALANWSQYYDLSQFDVYVSSWDQPGFSRLDRMRLNRRMAKPVADQVAAQLNDDEIEAIAKLDEADVLSSPAELEAQVRQALTGAKKTYIHLADGDEVVYKQMPNPEKMHFHNRYWIQKLGRDHFLNNYDVIIKTRPDILMNGSLPLRPDIVSTTNDSPTVLCDHPDWLFESWGFGMGDQLFAGQTALMLDVLDINFPQSLSTQLMTFAFGRHALTAGHINMGIELWLAGGKIAPLPITKRGLNSEKTLSAEDINRLCQQAGIDFRVKGS